MSSWLRFFDALSRGDRRAVKSLILWALLLAVAALALAFYDPS